MEMMTTGKKFQISPNPKQLFSICLTIQKSRNIETPSENHTYQNSRRQQSHPVNHDRDTVTLRKPKQYTKPVKSQTAPKPAPKPTPKPVEPAKPVEPTKPVETVKSAPREPVQMTTTLVKGQPKKVMDWSRCLKKEAPVEKTEPVASVAPVTPAEPLQQEKTYRMQPARPSLNLQPRSRKGPLMNEPHETPSESYADIEAALIQEAKMSKGDNLSMVFLPTPPHVQQVQRPSSPPLSPSTFVSQTSSIASSSTLEQSTRSKKNFSLGGFGITEAAQPIFFGTAPDATTPHTFASPAESDETPEAMPKPPVMNYYVRFTTAVYVQENYYPYSFQQVYDYSSMAVAPGMQIPATSAEEGSEQKGARDSPMVNQFYNYPVSE